VESVELLEAEAKMIKREAKIDHIKRRAIEIVPKTEEKINHDKKEAIETKNETQELKEKETDLKKADSREILDIIEMQLKTKIGKDLEMNRRILHIINTKDVET